MNLNKLIVLAGVFVVFGSVLLNVQSATINT